MKALESSDDRFEAFPDPLNNWIVWDRDRDEFAEVGTQVLSSLTQFQARAFCSLLNRLKSIGVNYWSGTVTADCLCSAIALAKLAALRRINAPKSDAGPVNFERIAVNDAGLTAEIVCERTRKRNDHHV
jgi:hypothetical protein